MVNRPGKKPNIFVLIPALNEEKSIGSVIDDIPKDIVTEIIVIDNGSTDGTAASAESHGATVLSETTRGYGHALMKGISYITPKNPDILVFLDGDYSDFPGEIPGIVKPILENQTDMVIGSRVLGDSEKGALLPQARFGNWLSTSLIRLFWGYKFTDLGPFRAIKFDKFQALDMKELTYGWTVEMQIKAAKMKYECAEVPVSYRKRIGQSKVTGTISGSVKAGIGILRTIFKSLFPRNTRKTQKKMKSKWTLILSGLLMELFYILYRLIDVDPAQTVIKYIVVYAASFIIMVVSFGLLKDQKFSRFFFLTVLLFSLIFGLTLVSSPPGQSDDIYRYLWDGKLQYYGISPYAFFKDFA